MDAELAAAAAFLVRPDLADIESTRILTDSSTLPRTSAEADYLRVVEVVDTALTVDREREVPIRIYKPRRELRAGSGILFLHGGAFVSGDLGSEHARCLRFAGGAGAVVVSVAYRLAPEAPYPAALLDCVAALEWIHEHANALGVDPARIAVGGVSAGGGLAAALTLLLRDRGGPMPCAQLLLFPVLDDRMATRSMQAFNMTPVWDNRNSALMWSHYLAGQEADEYAAPARAARLDGLPETYLLTAELDPLRDEALAFAGRLLAAGVSVDLRLWAGAYHVFDQLLPDAAISKSSLEDQVRFIRTALRP